MKGDQWWRIAPNKASRTTVEAHFTTWKAVKPEEILSVYFSSLQVLKFRNGP